MRCNMATEEWRDVVGFEGLYQISNFGRLKSFKENPNGRVLSLKNKNGDYFRVPLQGKGVVRKTLLIHRLVAQHFLPHSSSKTIVNHIDGNKQNNRVDNLEWTTVSGNVIHSIEHIHPEQIRPMVLSNNQRRRPVTRYSKAGTILATYSSSKEASLQTGICKRNIDMCAAGKRKTAGGSIWKHGGVCDD